MHWAFYLVIYLLPITVIMGYIQGGSLTFFTAFVIFVAVPIVDLVIGRDTENPTLEQETVLLRSKIRRVIPWIGMPAQLALMFWGAYIVSHRPLSLIELAGITISIGLTGGTMGINISHELAHRHNRWERFLSAVILWSVGYMHWGIEHVSGHHKNVATFGDAATARYRESFYRFLPRTVIFTFLSSWEIEKKRLARKNRSPWSLRNRILTYLLLTVALAGGLYLAWGPKALVFYVVQCFFAFSLLEVVNYIEHYGLLRKRDENGKYERVRPIHSWNAAEMFTNAFLFNLQRHSDHHAEPRRRYPILRHYDEVAQLPTGYAGMVVLAMIPPLYFRIMEPRIPAGMIELHKQYTADRKNGIAL